MNYIVLGNISSIFAMLFLFLAVAQKDNHKLITIQGVSYFFFALAGLILKGYSGLVQDIIGFIRNLCIATNKNNIYIRNILLVSGIVFGYILNNKGFLGIFPIIGTFQYSIVSFKKSVSNKHLQLSIILNAVLMIIYSFVIQNYVNMITNTITILISIQTLRKDFASACL